MDDSELWSCASNSIIIQQFQSKAPRTIAKYMWYASNLSRQIILCSICEKIIKAKSNRFYEMLHPNKIVNPLKEGLKNKRLNKKWSPILKVT